MLMSMSRRSKIFSTTVKPRSRARLDTYDEFQLFCMKHLKDEKIVKNLYYGGKDQSELNEALDKFA